MARRPLSSMFSTACVVVSAMHAYAESPSHQAPDRQTETKLRYEITGYGRTTDLVLNGSFAQAGDTLTIGAPVTSSEHVSVSSTDRAIADVKVEPYEVVTERAGNGALSAKARSILKVRFSDPLDKGERINIRLVLTANSKDAETYGTYSFPAPICDVTNGNSFDVSFEIAPSYYVSAQGFEKRGDRYAIDCSKPSGKSLYYSKYQSRSEFLLEYIGYMDGQIGASRLKSQLIGQIPASVIQAKESERLDYIIQTIRKNFRYVPLIEGRRSMYPRDLDDVISSKVADCKDMTLLVRLYATVLGLEINPVFLNSQMRVFPENGKPIPLDVDHMIGLETKTKRFVDLSDPDPTARPTVVEGHEGVTIIEGKAGRTLIRS